MNRNIKIVQFEKLRLKRKEIFKEILDFIGIYPQIDDDSIYERYYVPPKDGVRNNSTSAASQLKRLLSDGVKLNQTMNNLRRFFSPYNAELADLLGEEWRNIWM